MPDLDDLQFNKPEDEIDYSDMSIDELLESTREELAHDDELMGETPEQKARRSAARASASCAGASGAAVCLLCAGCIRASGGRRVALRGRCARTDQAQSENDGHHCGKCEH